MERPVRRGYHDRMSQDATSFLKLALELQALRFGSFTLKSGRQSPYFFNAGALTTGQAMAAIGRFYAGAIEAHDLRPDCIFGPAYKGIPIAAVTAAALCERHGHDIRFAYNRKEPKQHGEGGVLVGGPVAGRVVIVDDVITAGTAVRQAIGLIGEAQATVAGVVLALDRQERGLGDRSAVQELAAELDAPVLSIACLDDLISLLEADQDHSGHRAAMSRYRERYGVDSTG